MTRDLTRSSFLRRTAGVGGGALGVGILAAPALGAPSEQDLAWVRFGITVEVASAAYYRQARGTGFFSNHERRTLERATAAQHAHVKALRQTLIDAREAPIDPADLEVAFPDGSFDSRARTLSLGRRLGGNAVHAYLGAVTTVSDSAFRRVLGQVLASSAEQLAYLTGLAGPVITDPFPSVHGLGTAAEELARYLP
jgi:hypothetical protein